VARDRQRSKQRQAERRARRLEARGDGEAASRAPAREESLPPDALAAPPQPDALAIPPQPDALAAPEAEPILPPEPDADDLTDEEELLEPDDAEEYLEDEDYDPEDEEAPAPGPKGVRTRRQDEAAESDEHRRRHGKVVTFLLNVWAELQRVQWPDRQAVTTLTGVVLGFVLIAGGYLGLLDAIFSRLIEAIL
jgi:preprotein translocase subunit SecE